MPDKNDDLALAHCAALVEEARRAGLLHGKTEHVGFRAPRALIKAAKRATGLLSTTELCLAALWARRIDLNIEVGTPDRMGTKAGTRTVSGVRH